MNHEYLTARAGLEILKTGHAYAVPVEIGDLRDQSQKLRDRYQLTQSTQ